MEAAPGEPVDGVEPPHVPYKEAQYLTPEDSRRVVAALAGHEFELPILAGLSCGLRPAEYLALRWRDLDLDGCGLRVVQNVHRVRTTRCMSTWVARCGDSALVQPRRTDRDGRFRYRLP